MRRVRSALIGPAVLGIAVAVLGTLGASGCYLHSTVGWGVPLSPLTGRNSFLLGTDIGFQHEFAGRVRVLGGVGGQYTLMRVAGTQYSLTAPLTLGLETTLLTSQRRQLRLITKVYGGGTIDVGDDDDELFVLGNDVVAGFAGLQYFLPSRGRERWEGDISGGFFGGAFVFRGTPEQRGALWFAVPVVGVGLYADAQAIYCEILDKTCWRKP